MTTQTTIEALMYDLRRGIGMLAESGARSRLRNCNRTAVKQVARRLRAGHQFDPKWSESDVQTLLAEWRRMHGDTQ